jgi:hypothetical protein
MTEALVAAAAAFIAVAFTMACNGHKQTSGPILAAGVVCALLSAIHELSRIA